jgi:lsr operon transcriptional repressor
MPRLNIYLPDDVYELTEKWRGSANLSEICARAINDEFKASEENRMHFKGLDRIKPPSKLERALAAKFKLFDVVLSQAPADLGDVRDAIGQAAAAYLDRNVCDGSLLGIAGGRQIWSLVQHLSPRRVRMTLTALGMHQADPNLLHAHPNTIVTLMWLLYSPRSQAHVVGTPVSATLWNNPPIKSHPSYFVISSCSSFAADSPFAQLIGDELTEHLLKCRAAGDYAYTFFDDDGEEIEIPSLGTQFKLSAKFLRKMSARRDARIVLVAGGEEKLPTIRATLQARLCNTIITDEQTATQLME